MIIRNPYGFYAKHYKIIHLLLLVPLIYLMFCYQDIAKFFQSYISAGYSTPETSLTDTYMSGYIFLITFLLAIVYGAIYVILLSKKKSNLYYGICTLYFIAMLFFLLLYGSSMSSIEKHLFTSTFSHFVRDCAKTTVLPIYIVILINFVKGIGFNIKTLRFDGDIELKVTEEDEEDIEISIGNEGKDLKRTVVHIIRELKYYAIENKFVISCIGVVLLLIIGYNLYLDFEVYSKTYAVNQAFKLSNFTLSLKDSYITDVDYRGNKIEEDKYYLVIKIGIENNGPNTKIDKSSFRIHIGDQILYPSYDKGSRFLDIGATYKGDTIFKGEANDFVFVYELTKKQIRASYQMRILSSLTQTYDGLKSKYKKITIKPQNITKTHNLGKAYAGNEISFKDTVLGKTTYKIIDYEVSSHYQYSYDLCNGNRTSCTKIYDTIVPTAGNLVLIINDELKWDETTQYYKNSEHDFYADFVTLNYSFYKAFDITEEAKMVSNTIDLKNITPKALKDQNINVYEVPTTMEDAKKISLSVKIRNKYLNIIVKDEK